MTLPCRTPCLYTGVGKPIILPHILYFQRDGTYSDEVAVDTHSGANSLNADKQRVLNSKLKCVAGYPKTVKSTWHELVSLKEKTIGVPHLQAKKLRCSV